MRPLVASLRRVSDVASWASYALYGGFLAAARERRGAHAPSAHRTPRGTPWAISFLVTARCMLKCQHCFYHYATSTPETELSFDEYRALSRHLDKFTVALFCGGEPYLRPDLGETIAMLRKNHGVPIAATTTNGQLQASVLAQTEAILRADRWKPFGVGLSMDGPQEVHDVIRGKGSFDRTLRTYRELQRLGRHYPNLSLTVTTVVNSINQHVAADFVRWAAAELRPSSQCVLLVRQSPRAGDFLKEVDLDRYREAQTAAVHAMRSGALWRRLRPDALYFDAVSRHVAQTRVTGSRSFHCWAGVNGALIDPMGMVQVCEVFPEQPGVGQIGSLREHGMDFAAIWNSPRADEMRALVNRHEACASCTHETMGHITSIPFTPNRLFPAASSAPHASAARQAPPTGLVGADRLRRPRDAVSLPT